MRGKFQYQGDCQGFRALRSTVKTDQKLASSVSRLYPILTSRAFAGGIYQARRYLTDSMLADINDERLKKPDLKALTGLRFFAALAVVFYHFALSLTGGWPSPLVRIAGSGYAAVSFFFVLSGFILSYSYIGKGGSLRGTRRDFYVARVARIYPAYLLAFVLAAPQNIWSSLHVNAFPIAVGKLMASAFALLSLQQAWTPWTAWCWNFPAWSVSVESFFYLLFPWVAPALARLRLSTCLRLCGGLWLLSLVAPLSLFLLKGTTGPPELNDHMQMVVEFSPLLRLPEFLIGILIGRAFVSGLAERIPQRGVSYLSATFIFGLLAFVPGIPHPLLANGLLVPFFVCLILGLSKDQGAFKKLLSLPLLVTLGEASYGIYILQIPVSYLLHAPPPHHSLITFASYLMVLLVVSLLSWRFIELPLRTYTRRRFMVMKARAREGEMGQREWPAETVLTSSAGSE